MDSKEVAAPMTTTGPLAGVKVLDLTTTFMGPYCTLLLAEHGADVLKVEAPNGDINRYIGDVDDLGLGPIFINANLGKRSVVLDLGVDDDRALLHELIAESDVVVQSRPPGSARRLGTSPEALAAINPRAVLCFMHGFGSEGPYADRSAYDDVIQAVSGIAACQTGSGEPQYVRTPLADKITGQLAFGAVCAALYERESSGLGQTVEVPMFETMAQFLLLEQQGGYITDPPRGPHGYARLDSPYRRPFQTSDGHVGIVAHTDAHWRALFEHFARPDMATDPRFGSIATRTANIDELYTWLAERVRELDTTQCIRTLTQLGIPIAAVNAIPDLFADPHLDAVGMFRTVDADEAGRLRVARLPIRYSRTPAPTTVAAPPRLDAHGKMVRNSRSFATPEEHRDDG